MGRQRRVGSVHVAARVGRALVVTGMILVAFVAYQLWGTALYEHNAQTHLRAQLEAQLHQRSKAPHSGTPGAPTNAASSTSDNAVISAAAASAASAHAPVVGSPLGFITIPRIGLNDGVVVEGVGERQLEQGPGHYPGTPLPGQSGNVAIAGHRTTYGAPFYNLDQLHPGDAINLQVPQGTFSYQVVERLVVAPSDASVINPNLPLPLLTLTTCNPRYSAAQRLVVVALLRWAQLPAGRGGALTAAPPSATTTTVGRPTLAAHRAHPILPAGGAAGGVAGAVAWGVFFLLGVCALALFRRYLEGRVRVGAVALGSVGVVILLFVFFQHVSVALPSNF